MTYRICTLLVLAVLAFSGVQAQDIPGATFGITVGNAAGRSEYLEFGYREGATAGIDPVLGEYELPPQPPNEIFDARIISTPGKSQLGLGSKADFRDKASSTAPFTETFTVSWQAGESQTSVRFSWEMPLTGRVTRVRIDGNDIGTTNEYTTQFAQGQVTVEVTFDGRPLRFAVNPASLTFQANNRDPLPVKQLEIIPEGDTDAAWDLRSDALWLDLSASGGSGRTMIDVGINSSVLPAGTYTATLTIRSLIEPARTDVPVTLTMVVGVEDVAAPTGLALRSIHPNPAGSDTRIELDAGTGSQAIRLTVHDALGREVADLSSAVARRSGTQSVALDAAALPAGVYLCRLSDGRFARTQRLLVVR